MAESDEWLIDQAVAEYEAYCAGKLQPSVKTREFPNGELQFCGRLEDRSRWTISYVHIADRAVVPLAVGDFGHAFGVLSRLDQADARFEDPRLFPPPSARVGGVRYRFLPAQGCSLVGVVQLGAAAVLLSALGERIAVVYVEGGSRVVLDIKSPLGLGEVDVDGMLGFHRPRRAKVRRDGASAEHPAEVLAEPSPAIRAHHIRIVRGTPVDVGGGPTILEVLRSCFEDIVRRVEALKRPGYKLKGKTKLRAVLEVLLRLALSSCPTLVGRSGELLAEIKGRAPGCELTVEAFSDVLNLLRAARTCLVQRDEKERTWRINLAGLADPRSALHARLCKETAGRLRIREAAANQPPAPGKPGSIGGFGRGERPDAPSEEPPTSWLRDLLGARGTSAAERTTGNSDGRQASAGAGAAQLAAALAGGDAGAVGAGATGEALGDAARPGSKDDDPRPSTDTAGSPTADLSALADGAAAVLGQLSGASLVMLLAARFAVAQARREAEDVRMAELAAWEAERRALADQLDAAAEERAKLLALLYQLARLTVGPATPHVSTKYGVAPADETADRAAVSRVLDVGPETDRVACLSCRGEVVVDTAATPTPTNQVVQPEPLLAHRRVDEQASSEHGDVADQAQAGQRAGLPVFGVAPAPTVTAGASPASSWPAIDAPAEVAAPFTASANPAARARPEGSGPRGPPKGSGESPAASGVGTGAP